MIPIYLSFPPYNVLALKSGAGRMVGPVNPRMAIKTSLGPQLLDTGIVEVGSVIQRTWVKCDYVTLLT